MSAKRPSLKGKGAEIFLGEDTSQENSSEKSIHDVAEKLKAAAVEQSLNVSAVEKPNQQPAKQSAANTDDSKVEKEKATFYLPMDVLEELESLWHDVRRLTHKKIKKSEIVSIALQQTSDEFRAWQNEERKRSKLMDRLSG